MSREHLLVEFVGLPASGKTHFAETVKRRLDSDLEVPITTASEKRRDRRMPIIGMLIIGTLLAAPGRALMAGSDLRRTQQTRRRHLVRYWLYHLYLCAEWLRIGRNHEVHLSDQGFIQHVWRVRLTAADMAVDDVERFLHRHLVRTPDLVVFVEVDHQTRMQRGCERGTPVDPKHFDADHPAIKRDQQAYEDVKAAVLALASEEDGPATIVVENTAAALDRNAETVAETVVRNYRANLDSTA